VTVEDPVEYRLDGITQVQAIVEAMCFIVIVFLIVFVIPVFSKMYRQMHVPLPGPTQALINLSTLVRDGWWALLPIIIVTLLLLKLFWKKAHLKTRLDAFKISEE